MVPKGHFWSLSLPKASSAPFLPQHQNGSRNLFYGRVPLTRADCQQLQGGARGQLLILKGAKGCFETLNPPTPAPQWTCEHSMFQGRMPLTWA